jgi:ankyrin repeat protein
MRARSWTLVLIGWLGATAGCAPNKFCLGCVSEQESLVSAAELGDLKALRRLLDSGISPESRKGQWSALNRAVVFGQVEAVEALLNAGANINAHNPRIGSAVYLAATARRDELLARLLDRGAEPNVTPDWGLTPLMVGALQGNLAAISLLLEHGADPARRNPAGRSALDLARDAGHAEAARAIEKHLARRGG